MRLDKLVIGSPKQSPTHQFKNLKDVSLDFNENEWVTVVIGRNGTGKSNVLEALAIIFRDLIMKKRAPAFAFKLNYRLGAGVTLRRVHIDADPDRQRDPYLIQVSGSRPAEQNYILPDLFDAESLDGALEGKPIKLAAFLNADAEYLPRYVFSYYSGESTRMQEVFRPYLDSYDSKLRNGEDPGLKRLFYSMPVHSQFVLLAFLIQQSKIVRDFLNDHMGLDPEEGIESVLFVLHKPPWKSKVGDPRFWNSRGVVQNFLHRLYDIALAPINVKRNVPTSPWNRTKLEFKYLYVKDIDALRKLVGTQAPASFFRDLESTYVSEMIEEVRIRVRLKKNDGIVTFRELSEGEQQWLIVLGLLRFMAEDESLFLLDEPDTHLNPRWSVDYISYLQKFVTGGQQREESSHILLATHNPLAIAELTREQVQILRLEEIDGRRRILSCHPEMDPRGMGYAAIVTSDMFGITSSLDESTRLLLEKQRGYAALEKRLSPDEQRDLDKTNAELDRLGFRFFHPDDEYARYLKFRNAWLVKHFEEQRVAALAEKVVKMSREEREALSKRLIAEMLADKASGSEAGRS